MTKFVVIGIFLWTLFLSWKIDQLHTQIQHIQQFIIMQQLQGDPDDVQPGEDAQHL
jgi:hypothetical protein